MMDIVFFSILDDFRATLNRNTAASRIVCGGIAGSVAKTVVAPFERVKMRFQIRYVLG